jgi:hypothetical protein
VLFNHVAIVSERGCCFLAVKELLTSSLLSSHFVPLRILWLRSSGIVDIVKCIRQFTLLL